MAIGKSSQAVASVFDKNDVFFYLTFLKSGKGREGAGRGGEGGGYTMLYIHCINMLFFPPWNF